MSSAHAGLGALRRTERRGFVTIKIVCSRMSLVVSVALQNVLFIMASE